MVVDPPGSLPAEPPAGTSRYMTAPTAPTTALPTTQRAVRPARPADTAVFLVVGAGPLVSLLALQRGLDQLFAGMSTTSAVLAVLFAWAPLHPFSLTSVLTGDRRAKVLRSWSGPARVLRGAVLPIAILAGRDRVLAAQTAAALAGCAAVAVRAATLGLLG